jgi:ubiquitin carboxyl-terminal hydrolase L5
MNLPDIELGPTLQSLKDFTSALDPGLCGYQVCNHDFIRQIHNSFSRQVLVYPIVIFYHRALNSPTFRKMDMLNADLALSNDVDAKNPKRKRGSRRYLEEEQPQPGFHFVAFVPIRGSVWKLDGLEREPTNLGTACQQVLALRGIVS